MNTQFNNKSNGGASAFQVMTPTIDFSDTPRPKLIRRNKAVDSNEKLISEEELLQYLWQF